MDDLSARLERLEATVRDLEGAVLSLQDEIRRLWSAYDIRTLWLEGKAGMPMSYIDRVMAEDAARERWPGLEKLEKDGPWSLSWTK